MIIFLIFTKFNQSSFIIKTNNTKLNLILFFAVTRKIFLAGLFQLGILQNTRMNNHSAMYEIKQNVIKYINISKILEALSINNQCY